MTKIENLKKKEKCWYAVYTKPRWEKKAHKLLTLKSIDCYLPLNKIRKKYSDRYKVVEEPLFNSYLFVYITEKEKTEVKLTDGVIKFVYYDKKDAVVAEKDIITIKKFLKEYVNVSLETLDYKIGQKLIIDEGIFMGREGEVIKVMENKVIAKLNSLGFTITAEIDKKSIVLL
jgi:transcription antitermination factor NusG